METKDPQEQLRIQLRKAHLNWIENPTTQVFLQWLENRETKKKAELMEGVLVKSDKEMEDKLRACISTYKAVSVTLRDPETFIAEMLKDKQ